MKSLSYDIFLYFLAWILFGIWNGKKPGRGGLYSSLSDIDGIEHPLLDVTCFPCFSEFQCLVSAVQHGKDNRERRDSSGHVSAYLADDGKRWNT